MIAGPRYDRELTTEELLALSDEDIDLSDIPELDETFWKNAVVIYPDRTQSVTLRGQEIGDRRLQGAGQRLSDADERGARKLCKVNAEALNLL